jgi:hypothetical protein
VRGQVKGTCVKMLSHAKLSSWEKGHGEEGSFGQTVRTVQGRENQALPTITFVFDPFNLPPVAPPA